MMKKAINMSSKEISKMTGKYVATPKMARSRIWTKLGVSNTQVDLVGFLSKF